MTIRAVLRCDGEWPPGEACRQATPVGDVANGAEARRIGRATQGWMSTVIDGLVRDLCRSCWTRHLQSLIPGPRDTKTAPPVEAIQ